MATLRFCLWDRENKVLTEISKHGRKVDLVSQAKRMVTNYDMLQRLHVRSDSNMVVLSYECTRLTREIIECEYVTFSTPAVYWWVGDECVSSPFPDYDEAINTLSYLTQSDGMIEVGCKAGRRLVPAEHVVIMEAVS